MGVLSWIIVGGLAGLIAGKIMGKGHGFIGNKVDGINLTSILIAAGGAVILLALLRLIRGKQ